ncbi:MAG: glycosyltransferase family 4 protein [Patescibacteria group bacterium]
MKIAVYYNLPPGGAKRILYEQIKELSIKHRIDVYTLSSFNEKFLSIKPFCKEFVKYNFNLKSNLPFFLSRLEKDYKNFISLRKLHKKIANDINEKGYDLVFVHTDVLTEAPFILRYIKSPSVYYCEELLRIVYEKELDIDDELFFVNRYYEKFTRIIRKRIDKKNAKSADLILTSSIFIKNRIKKAYGENAVVCYPGVDCKYFTKADVPKDNKVLFLGSKSKIDGYDLVKESLTKIPVDIRPNLQILEFSKKGPKIQNDKVLIKEYSSSFLTLCLDIAEPFGLKVLESLACGTPVIAVNDGGYKETVKNGTTGYLIKRNSKILAEKITYLLKNKDKYKYLSKNGIRDIQKNWKWNKGTKVIEEEFKNLLKVKSLKSTILISGLDSGGLGGAENFTLQLSKSFFKKRYKTHVASVNKTKFNNELIKSDSNILKVPFRMDVLGNKKGLIKFIFLFIPSTIINLKLLIKFKRNGGKIVIIPGFSDKLLLSLHAKLLSLKVIWIEYANPDSLFKRNFGIPKFLYNLSVPFIDKLIVPTNYLKNEFISEMKFKKDLIQVIPCGTEILSSEKINLIRKKKEVMKNKLGIKGKKVIGMISRIEKGKGQEKLLKTIPYLKNKLDKFVILIAGDGDYSNLKKLSRKLNIEKYVKFVGYYKDKYELISTFDVFVFPTKWELEGFGLVSLEAMLMEVPLITSDMEVVREVVGDSALISKITPKDLSKNIMKVLSDKRLRERLIKSGTKRVNSLYNIDNIADQYLKLIN